MRRKAEQDKGKIIDQLLAAKGLELDTDDEETRYLLLAFYNCIMAYHLECPIKISIHIIFYSTTRTKYKFVYMFVAENRLN